MNVYLDTLKFQNYWLHCRPKFNGLIMVYGRSNLMTNGLEFKQKLPPGLTVEKLNQNQKRAFDLSGLEFFYKAIITIHFLHVNKKYNNNVKPIGQFRFRLLISELQ